MKDGQYLKHIYTILLIFAAALLVVTLKFTAVVTLPITVALLISCASYPLIKKMNQKLHMPWILCTLLCTVLIVIIIAAISTIVGKSVTTILSQYSKYESRLMSIYSIFAGKFNLNIDNDKSFFENIWASFKIREFLQKIALNVSGNVISLVKNLTMILLFSVFLLIEMKNGREKVDSMFRNNYQGRILKILKKTISETVSYISIKFLISVATGVLIYLIILPIRMDFAIMWGFLAFIMNFIPTFGSIFSVGLATIFALIQFYPSLWQTVYVLALTTSVNMVLGNVVEPKIEGENLGLSPFVILAGLTVFNWIWGFVGMILAVPMMVIVKIICENVTILHPIAILMGNKPKDVEKEFNSDEEDIPENIKNESISHSSLEAGTENTVNEVSDTADNKSGKSN